MLLSRFIPSPITIFSALILLGNFASAYFKITQPTTSTQWVNGQNNVVTWTKGVLDGIDSFDVELGRLSQQGLIFVASNVPTKNIGSSMSLYLQDIPPADDYFLFFLNSTHGVIYSISDKFTILSAGSTSNATAAVRAAANAPTVSVSGSPNPTAVFATTFPATSNGHRAWRLEGMQSTFVAVGSALAVGLMSAVITLW